MNRNSRHFCFLFLFLTSALVMDAQTSVGTGFGSIGDPSQAVGNPASSYALSSLEHLNYYTGSVNVDIPILTIGGRGDVSRTITIPIQRAWTVDTTNAPNSAMWSIISGYYTSGFISFSTSSPNPYYCYSSTSNAFWGNQATSYIVWHSFDGTETYLTDTRYNGQPRDPDGSCQPANRGRVFRSTDGSDLTFISNSDISDGDGIPRGTLITRDGIKYTFSGDTYVSQIEDRNGNQIHFSFQSTPDGGIYTVTDAVGRESQINFTESLTTDAQDVLTYSGFQGQRRTIKVNYSLLEQALGPNEALLPYSRLFPELNGSSSSYFNPYVISSVVLADGTSYQMGYNGYGELTKLVLPTRGYYTYQYPEAYNGGVSGAIAINGGGYRIFRPLVSRDEHANGDDTVTARMLFSVSSSSSGLDSAHPSRPGAIGSASFYEIANNSLHLLRKEQHYFYGDPASNATPAPSNTYPDWWEGLEFRTDISDGSSLLQSVQRTYQQRPWAGSETNQWFDPQQDGVPSHDPELVSETTIQDWAVKQKTYGYDAYNNRTDEWDYDWGAGAPGVFLRHLQTNYVTDQAYLDANLVSLPTAITVTDASNPNLWSSHRVLCYDESPTNGGFPGYCRTATGTRGNVTTDTSWLAVGQSFKAYPADQYTYDNYGNVLSHRDPNGNTTTYAYSDGSYAHPNSIISPPANGVQQVTSIQYDYSTGKLIQVTDPNNVATSYFYNDLLDRMTETKLAVGSSVETHLTTTYNDPTWTVQCQGKITADDCGLRTDSVYDGFGRLIESRQREYDTNTYIATDTLYDALGRVHSTTNPSRVQLADGSRDGLGFPTYYSYDALNRIKDTTLPDGSISHISYSGNQNTVTDPAGRSRTNYLDGLDRLVAVADASGNTYYGYNLLGNLTNVAQGSQTRTFVYDSLSRLVSATNPESGVTSYEYDYNGNLLTKTDYRGLKTHYGYDSLSRRISTTYEGDSTPGVTYSYGDSSGIPNAKGRLTQVSNSSSVTTYDSFDPLGRVLTSRQIQNGLTYPFSYQYNLAGWLTSETYPSRRTVVTCYDVSNRTSAVVLGSCANPTKSYVSGMYPYWPHGAPYAFWYGNTVVPVSRYNERLQPSLIYATLNNSDSQWLFLDYLNWNTPYNNGNLAATTQQFGNAVPGSQLTTITQSFGYDGVNRLHTASDSGGWSRTFDYDQQGNAWVSGNSGVGLSPATPQGNVYNAKNQNLYEQYDPSGNQTTFGGLYILKYDAENHLISAQSNGGPNAAYLYDGLDRRVQKTVTGGPTSVYVYDAVGQLAAEYSTAAATPPCQTCYLTYDHLGSVRMVTNENGQIVSRHDYLPFGEEIPGGTASRSSALFFGGSDQVNQRFTGQIRDSETNLDFFNTRYLSAALGRFTSPDPANAGANSYNPQSWNGYAYVLNNPLNSVDPDGLTTCDSNGDNCHDEVTVNGGSDEGVPWWWSSFSFLWSWGSSSSYMPFPRVAESQSTTRPQKNGTKTCPAVPAHPPNASVAANASEAGKLRWLLPPLKEFVFYLDVRNGSPWDYKRQGRTLSDLGTIGPSPYQDFGNFNFGVVGAAAGFPAQELLRGAGYAQQQAGTSSPQWGHWYSPNPPYGDDPSDQAMIRAGIAYYQNGCVQ